MSYTTLVPLPDRNSINTGLSPAKLKTLYSIFGDFPGLATTGCDAPVQNERIKELSSQEMWGPFSATGILPVLAALELVLDDLKAAHPDLWNILSQDGMICYRVVKCTSHPSNHAAGTAIDLMVGGILPALGATEIPNGFLILYTYFHQRGFYWGLGYNPPTKPDPMHFEVADETLSLWKLEGKV